MHCLADRARHVLVFYKPINNTVRIMSQMWPWPGSILFEETLRVEIGTNIAFEKQLNVRVGQIDQGDLLWRGKTETPIIVNVYISWALKLWVSFVDGFDPTRRLLEPRPFAVMGEFKPYVVRILYRYACVIKVKVKSPLYYRVGGSLKLHQAWLLRCQPGFFFSRQSCHLPPRRLGSA